MSFLLGAAMPFIGRMAGGLVKRGIDWIKNRVSAKRDSPLFKFALTTANVVGKERFDNAMRLFGDNILHRLINSKLKPVAERYNVGDQFHKQMSNIFDFVKGKTKTGPNEEEFTQTRYPGKAPPKADAPGTATDVAANDDIQMY